MQFRVGLGYDSHRFALDRPLVIGGIRIPFDKGLAAHSDGDVLIHAICDALLGAAALKDIGTHFPDNDPQYQNADSKVLLQRVMELINSRGWTINNLDCTLILEEPKMKPHIDEMVATLAPLLHLDADRLSIKAKTNERMGFTGQKEGVAAMAMVSLIQS